MADSREELCDRIVNNINQLTNEKITQEKLLETLRKQLDRLESELQGAVSRLRALESPSITRDLPRRILSPVGSLAVSVGAAVAQERARADAQSDVNQLRAQVSNVNSKIERTQRSIQEKDRPIKQSQGSFNRYDCFGLGFSHEVLNLR